ncbi:MAG: hypothetical protein QXD04_03315 [Candidatus Bathyarchaeia archaeon]
METRDRMGVKIYPVILLACLLILPAQAQVQLQSVKLPDDTPIPWQMALDPSGRYLWFAGGMGTVGYAVRVDTAQVLADPASATRRWEVAPPYHPNTGSSYAVTFGIAIGGGHIWIGSQYTGGDDAETELLSRFNPTTLEVRHYWAPAEAKYFRAVRYDPDLNCVWIAGNKLFKFNTSTETFEAVLNLRYGYDLLLDGDQIWITSADPKLIAYNKRDGSVREYPIQGWATMLIKGPDGNIWFTKNRQRPNLGVLDPQTGEVKLFTIDFGFDLDGFPQDAPYGLAFDGEGLLWLAGYHNKSLVRVNPASGAETSRLTTDNRPFYPVRQESTIWCWGQGSVYMNRIQMEAPKPPKPPAPSVGGVLEPAPASWMPGTAMILISATLTAILILRNGKRGSR